MTKLDPGHKVSSSNKANFIFYSSGLGRKEMRKFSRKLKEFGTMKSSSGSSWNDSR